MTSSYPQCGSLRWVLGSRVVLRKVRRPRHPQPHPQPADQLTAVSQLHLLLMQAGTSSSAIFFFPQEPPPVPRGASGDHIHRRRRNEGRAVEQHGSARRLPSRLRPPYCGWRCRCLPTSAARRCPTLRVEIRRVGCQAHWETSPRPRRAQASNGAGPHLLGVGCTLLAALRAVLCPRAVPTATSVRRRRQPLAAPAAAAR